MQHLVVANGKANASRREPEQEMMTPQDDGTQKVDVKMTLTAQGCGMGATIAFDAKQKLMTIAGISEANVDIVWDPPWNPQMISPEGRERLGID